MVALCPDPYGQDFCCFNSLFSIAGCHEPHNLYMQSESDGLKSFTAKGLGSGTSNDTISVDNLMRFKCIILQSLH